MVGSTTLILVSLNFTTAINVSLVNAVATLTLLLAILFLKDRVRQDRSARNLLGSTRCGHHGVKSQLVGHYGLEFSFATLSPWLLGIGFSSYALNLKTTR